MSLEIINKVRETENQIRSMQADVNTAKDTIVTKMNDELANYKAELTQSVKQFASEMQSRIDSQVNQASAQIDGEVSVLAERLNNAYASSRDQLVKMGLEEVLRAYGHSSHEESRISG